ncbi:MAG: transposase, partial [Nitrospinaceae bacterium]|nr:transposase [Nitrospinaceae bacterium]
AKGWKSQLKKVAELIGPGKPVWARMDNAYYRREVVEFCESHGWDYSISVTSETYKKPLRRQVAELSYKAWKPINKKKTEYAALVYHCPAGWGRKRPYLVIRKDWDQRQKRMFPTYVYILVSRDDLPLKELVRRHRGKQGQENAFKGPLIHLDLHHPPCQKFNANRAFYTAGQIAQMLLVAVQYQLLPEEARQHGIRSIIRDLVRAPGKLVSHARKLKLLFAKSSLKLHWIAHAADRIEALANAPP